MFSILVCSAFTAHQAPVLGEPGGQCPCSSSSRSSHVKIQEAIVLTDSQIVISATWRVKIGRCGEVPRSVISVTQLCPTLWDPMNCSTPGLPVHHQLPEFTQTHIHRVGDAIQPSYPLSSPSPPAPNPSEHQGLFQWVNSLHEVAKVLEFQL